MARLPLRARLGLLAALLALGSWPLAHAVEGSSRYVVKPGDTLGTISQNVGIPVDSLAALNQLPNPDLIVAGQALILEPPAEGRSQVPPLVGGAAAARQYTVRPGDTLSKIALQQGLPLRALLEANGLTDPDRIVAGQTLTLPASGPAAEQSEPAAAPTQEASGPEAGGIGGLLEAAAARHGLDVATVKALAWYLSGWRSDAASGTGAVGPMQVTGATQDWVARSLLKRQADRTDPRDNVEIGVAYLAYLVQRQGEERQAVAAYLQGPAGLARDGVTSSTARALESIYHSRERFSGAAATPPPAETRRLTGLADRVTAALATYGPGARVGLAARNLNTGEELSLRADEVFPSASVNKVPILIEALRQIEAGKLARTPALSSDLARMIVLSDNDAANRVLDAVGERRVNATMASLGLGQTVLHNYFSYNGGPHDPGFNQTSPSDMAHLLTLLATDQAISPTVSQEARALLLRTQDSTKLARGIPPGTRVAHKSGWYTGVANDAGIVYTPSGAYVVAVFSQGLSESEAGNELLAGVSRVIYEAWAGQNGARQAR